MMTKQEEIRKGIAGRLYDRARLPSIPIRWRELTPFAKECWLHLADREMRKLSEAGVGIIVKPE